MFYPKKIHLSKGGLRRMFTNTRKSINTNICIYSIWFRYWKCSSILFNANNNCVVDLYHIHDLIWTIFLSIVLNVEKGHLFHPRMNMDLLFYFTPCLLFSLSPLFTFAIGTEGRRQWSISRKVCSEHFLLFAKSLSEHILL